MSDSKTTTASAESGPKAVPASVAAAAAAAKVALDEFCTELSTTDRRVEMIGAFHSMERRAGRTVDTSVGYRARYEAFCKAPA